MTLVQFNNSDNVSPFDSIRHYDERGNEFWYARELMPLLNISVLYSELPIWMIEKFKLQTHKEKLDSQDMGLLLLEMSGFCLSLRTYRSVLDALYLYRIAFDIYKGQSLTTVFHHIYFLINQELSNFGLEYNYHSYIKNYYEALFDSAVSLEHEVQLDSGLRVDFVLNKNIPIEVKKEEITNSDIKQLQGYIKEMKAKKGYLIGPKNNQKLPNNIIFIEVTRQMLNCDALKNTLPLSSKLELQLLAHS